MKINMHHFSIVCNDGVNLTNTWVYKNQDNITIDTSTKQVENINKVYHKLADLQMEATREFNCLDFDVEYARSIHPSFNPNWKENLFKGEQK